MKWLNDGSDGHMLYYAQSKNFQKGLMEITVDDASARKYTVKKLKKGKTYYFKVKSYTNVTNEATGETLKVYGKDSKVLKVKVRK